MRKARGKSPGSLTIFVPSLASREVSEDCRVANVVSLFKGSRDNKMVSLTSVGGKLLTRIPRDRIHPNIEEDGQNKDSRQCGFIRSRLRLTNLTTLFYKRR